MFHEPRQRIFAWGNYRCKIENPQWQRKYLLFRCSQAHVLLNIIIAPSAVRNILGLKHIFSGLETVKQQLFENNFSSGLNKQRL